MKDFAPVDPHADPKHPAAASLARDHAVLSGRSLRWAVASDITYLNSTEIQWSNFSAWFITGGLVFGAPVLLWAVIGAFVARKRDDGRRRGAYLVLSAFMWLFGLVNAFQHSKDGWSSVGTVGVTLSILTALLALIAAWIGFSGHRTVEKV